MDWTLAKKMVLFVLIFINIGLFIINLTQKEYYNISSAQEKHIGQLLNRNGIVLNSEIDINYKPMSRLESQLYTYNKNDIEKFFFNGNLTILSSTRNVDTGIVENVYENQKYKLYTVGTSGVFTKKDAEWTTINMQELEAIKLAEKEVDKLEPLFGNMVNTQSYYTSEGWIIEFSERKDEYLVYSNKFKVYISDYGVYKIEFDYCDILRTSNETRDIISPDEALLAFVRYWANREDVLEVVNINENVEREGMVADVSIELLELGYYIREQMSLFIGTKFYMEPCYIIYLNNYTNPYFVNAYTGEVVTIEN